MGLFDDAPVLEGWITLTDAAAMLRVSKQAVHKMVASGKITTLHKIGNKPLYVVREAEIRSLAARREEDRTLHGHSVHTQPEHASGGDGGGHGLSPVPVHDE